MSVKLRYRFKGAVRTSNHPDVMAAVWEAAQMYKSGDVMIPVCIDNEEGTKTVMSEATLKKEAKIITEEEMRQWREVN